VGVIGDDFPQQALDELRQRGVSLDGVQVVTGGRSFRWSGRYEYDMTEAETLDTQLNVFADFDPVLPESARHCGYVFLANILPSLQLKVLDQVQQPRLTICDTMNFWIEQARDEVLEVFRRVDVATMNDAELRQLTGEPNLAKAATQLLEIGPDYLIIKKGEYGASLIWDEGHFALPCYPLPTVVDPTGAGDSFAGGLIGFLSWTGGISEQQLRQALAIGTVTASACVEDFSINALRKLTVDSLYKRYEALHEMVRFEEISEQAILST
jgi:sugar/nucleoside kinase (ribokinase family)